MQSLELSFACKDESLTAKSFSIKEEMNGLWECDVVARSHADDLDIAQFVGKGASFKIQAELLSLAKSRVYGGVVAEMDQIAIDTSPNGLSTYTLKIVPPLWRTTLRTNSRVFQHLSIPDIVLKVLSEWSIQPKLEVQASKYPKLEYKVQYMETDYAFVSRLLEEAGIAFWFPHDDGQELALVLADTPQNAALRGNGAIEFEDHPTKGSNREFVTAVRLAQKMLPGHATIRDYDFRQKPDYQLYQDFKAQGTKDAEDKYEHYVYQPGAFWVEPGKGGDTPVADDKGVARVDEKFGKALAEKTLEALRRDRLRVTLSTNCSDLVPGTVFAIKKHPRKDLAPDKKLLVVSSVITGGEGLPWEQSVESVFCDAVYRPLRRTPKPRVRGVQSAMVVGPKGEEIHTDEFGRVRVQFHWDREGKYDDDSSCWMRVSQGSAGFSYGLLNIPRVGHEVIVDFFEGDPDQPVVIGRVHNNTTRVPYKLPENKTKSGWKTDSSPGSNGFNELSFDDLKGKELIHIQAEKDLTEIVKNDKTLTVLGNRTSSVTKADTVTVGGDQSFAIDGSQSVQVGKDQSFDVVGDRTSTIGGTDNILVGSKHAVSVGSGAGITITEQQIVLTTGGATIVMTADSILLSATGGIAALTNGNFKMSGGHVAIDGGPKVEINTLGPTPAQPSVIQHVTAPKKPGAPATGGEVSISAPILSGRGAVEIPEGFETAVTRQHKRPEDAPKKLSLDGETKKLIDDAVHGKSPAKDLKSAEKALLQNSEVKKGLELAKIGKEAIKTKGKSLLKDATVKGEIGKLVTQPVVGKLSGADIADLLNQGEKFGIVKLGKKSQSVLDYAEGAAGNHPNQVASALGSMFSKPVVGGMSVGDLASLAGQGQQAGLYKMGGKASSIVGEIGSDVSAAHASDSTTMMLMRTESAPDQIDPSLIDDHDAAYQAAGLSPGAAMVKAAALQGVAMYAENALGQMVKLPIPF